MHISFLKQNTKSLLRMGYPKSSAILLKTSYEKFYSNQGKILVEKRYADNDEDISELQNKIKTLEKTLQENQMAKIQKDRNVMEETSLLAIIGCILLFSLEGQQEKHEKD